MRRRLFAALLSYFLYFYGLTSAGLVGPDEPRYASIAREMASSGDWLTPRLWGETWFEKPPLLYWIAGIGFRAGLGDDLAPRLGVALLSVAFLLFFYAFLRRQFDVETAQYATLILGASAGWIAYSHACATDLPMSAFLGAAMLSAMPWLERGETRWLPVTGACLGFAVLAKGLVPLVLAAPLLFLGIQRLRDWLRAAPGFFLVALPWYLFCTWKYGRAFLDEFFLRHHFERFATDSLQHVQPFWFYLPVLIGGLFPWSPLLVLAGRGTVRRNPRLRLFVWWLIWGFVFFSASANKLPGYLLPLLPAASVLIGAGLKDSRRPQLWLASGTALLGFTPLIAAVLPEALSVGLSRAELPGEVWWWGLPAIVIAAFVAWSGSTRALWIAAVAVTAAITYLKAASLPAIDRQASARQLWRALAPHQEQICAGNLHRAWRYGLNYYSVTPIVDCSATPRPWRLEQAPGRLPVLRPSTE
jgi:4-amino-4-deoxy-L-arabinose transferase-like glycosyltransferase